VGRCPHGSRDRRGPGRREDNLPVGEHRRRVDRVRYPRRPGDDFVGFGLAILFLRIVDTKAQMPISYLGAAWNVLSTLIPALVGENVTTLLLWPALGAIGCAFAFEAILKFDIEAESSRKAAMPTRTHCTESVRELQRRHPAAWSQASRIRIRPLSFAVRGTDVDEAGRCGWCR